MPPSNSTDISPSVNTQKVECQINARPNVTEMALNGCNLMNLGEGKNPVLKKWQILSSDVLAEAFNPNSDRVSIRLGEQLNGRYIVSIDFDCFGQKNERGERCESEPTIALYRNYIANNRLDGMYSSSTQGNFNVLVDITDVPEIYEMCSSYPKNHWDKENVQFLVRQDAQQVVPPTATINKRTNTLGNPRKFLNNVPIYKLSPADTFMIGFFKDNYRVDAPKKVLKSKAPIRQVTEQEPDDEWTELLFKVIKNDVVNGKYAISYERWMGIGTILKHNNYPLSIFKRWTMMCPLNQDDGKIEQYWDSIKGEGFSIYALQGIAKSVNQAEYKAWFVKHKKYLSLKTLGLGMNDVAQFMKSILKEHCVYAGKDNGWYRNTGALWIQSDDAPLATITTQLQRIIDLSRETLLAKKNATENDEEKKKLEEDLASYTKHYWVCGGSGYSTHISKLLKEYLLDAEFPNRLNQLKYKVVYRNGIYDMKTKKFRSGIYPQEFISKTLPYDYEEGDAKTIAEIYKQLKRICNNNNEQVEYYLSVLGYTLTGDATRENYLWYMCGETACNGKSSVLEALTDILPIYFKRENREHIDKKDKMWHKAVATWSDYRAVWVNEATEEPKNAELLKAICDGAPIQFPKLYGNSTMMPIAFKLFIVSNYQLKIKMDNGIERRFIHEQFDSKFTLSEGEQEDEKNCIFYKNKDFGKWLNENKHSLLQLIYEYSYRYAERQCLPKVPAEWDAIKKETVASLNVFESNLMSMCVLGENEECWNDDALFALEVEDSGVIKAEMKKLKKFHKYESQTKKGGKKGLHKGFRLKTKAETDAEEKAEDAKRIENGKPLPPTEIEGI